MGQCCSAPRADAQHDNARPVNLDDDRLQPLAGDKVAVPGNHTVKSSKGALPDQPVAPGGIAAGVQHHNAASKSDVAQYASLVSSPEKSVVSELSAPEEYQTYEEGQWEHDEDEAGQAAPAADPIDIEDIRMLNTVPSPSEGHGAIPIRRPSDARASNGAARSSGQDALEQAGVHEEAAPHEQEEVRQGQPAHEPQTPEGLSAQDLQAGGQQGSHLDVAAEPERYTQSDGQLGEQEGQHRHVHEADEDLQQEQHDDKAANYGQEQLEAQRQQEEEQQGSVLDAADDSTATQSRVASKPGVLSVTPDAPLHDRDSSRQRSAGNSGASTPTGDAASPRAGSAAASPRTPRSNLPRVATLASSKAKTADQNQGSPIGATIAKRAAASKGPVSMWLPGKTPPPPSRIPINQVAETADAPAANTPTTAATAQRSRARSTPGGNAATSPPSAGSSPVKTPGSAATRRKSNPDGAATTTPGAATKPTAGTSGGSAKPKAVRIASDKALDSSGSSAKLHSSKSMPAKPFSPQKAAITPIGKTGADIAAAEARARRRAKSQAGGVPAATPAATKPAATSPLRSKSLAAGAGTPASKTLRKSVSSANGAGGIAAASKVLRKSASAGSDGSGGAAVAAEPQVVEQSAASDGEAAASVQQAGLPPLEHGRWVLTRVGRRCTCAAKQGTVMMDTLEGQQELFQCNVTFQEGSLAAACLHDSPAGGDKAWLFCPDPLCLASKPEGSSLPDWPWAMPVQAGVELSAREQEELSTLSITPITDQQEAGNSIEAQETNTQ